jgi:hypothetical protein
MAKVSGIEIQGLKELQDAFKHLPDEVNASVIRNVARKPGNKIIARARELADYLTPLRISKRTIGIMPVKNLRQKFIEIGIKGKSWLYVFMFSKGTERQKESGASTGTINPVGNLIQQAAYEVQNEVTREMEMDLSKIIAKAFKRYAK